jgi:hypothetical protein
VLALIAAGCALFTAPALGGAAAVNLFPNSVGSPVSWVALSFFWWSGALGVGAALVAMGPRSGMAACATLAVVAEAALIAFGMTTPSRDLWRPEFLLFYTTALVVAAPLVAGGALARRHGYPFRSAAPEA